MKATIQTQGSQFIVEKGDKLSVNRFPNTSEGDQVKIEQVLMLVNEGKPTFGSPTIKGTSVTAKILENKRDKKIIIFKNKFKEENERAPDFRIYKQKALEQNSSQKAEQLEEDPDLI